MTDRVRELLERGAAPRGSVEPPVGLAARARRRLRRRRAGAGAGALLLVGGVVAGGVWLLPSGGDDRLSAAEGGGPQVTGPAAIEPSSQDSSTEPFGTIDGGLPGSTRGTPVPLRP